MNILLLGNGYIGSNLGDHISSKLEYRGDPVDVTVMSKSDTDYTRREVFEDVINNHWDFVVNCSGYTGYPNVDACEDDKENCWYHNVTVPAMLAEVCDSYSIPFGQVSSGCIYTGYDKDYTEEDTPNFGIYNPDSSFYSKSKHAGELALSNYQSYVWRIRMPFCSTGKHKNILMKILNYNRLISMRNSLTSVDDLCEYIGKVISRSYTSDQLPCGVYNVVNEGGLTARQITRIMSEYHQINPEWEFVRMKDLDLKAGRSNCVLSQDKNKKYGIDLPSAVDSLRKSLTRMSEVSV